MEVRALAGPLSGVRVIELEAVGPVPFAAMLLSDMGADVTRVARPGDPAASKPSIIDRGRRTVVMDLKSADDQSRLLDMVCDADILLEGHRPGVMERLGLAPETLHSSNPALVIGRLSAWGQEGPLSRQAAHDINILAQTGVLAAIGRDGVPSIPLNLVADYGGGALYLALGVVSALVEARTTERGCVVDCGMADATLSLFSLHCEMWQTGEASLSSGSNMLDGGAPFYAVYRCSDGGFMAVGAIEHRFYREFLSVLQLTDDPLFARQHDRLTWPECRTKLAELFGTRSRSYWTGLFETVDACVSPVLNLEEAAYSAAFRSRNMLLRIGERMAPAQAPRFTRFTRINEHENK